MNRVIAFDATNCFSGGAISHLNGLLSTSNNTEVFIHVFGHKKLEYLCQNLDNVSFHLVDHGRTLISFVKLFLWKLFVFRIELTKINVDLVFVLDAGSFFVGKKFVVISQDMLPFMPGEKSRYSFLTFQRYRLELLKILSVSNFRRAEGVIFLSDHAKREIEKYVRIKNSIIIPHGIAPFFNNNYVQRIYEVKKSYKFIYVSHLEKYKHHTILINAFLELERRLSGVFKLDLVGAEGSVAAEILELIKENDFSGKIIRYLGPVLHSDLPGLYKDYDYFIYSSTCENLPVTVLEVMSYGLPIFCSNRSPMVDVLNDSAIYFDPEEVSSIVNAIIKFYNNFNLIQKNVVLAKQSALDFTWRSCSDRTFEFLMNF